MSYLYLSLPIKVSKISKFWTIKLEILGRYEENAYLMRMMKVVGHKETKLYELDGYGHDMTLPAFPLLLNEVEKISKQKK